MSSVFSLVIDADDTASKMISRLGASQGTLYELPTCPVSLEPMDSAIACLLIAVPCSHLILCLCLSNRGDNRFVIYSESMVNKMCLTFWSILSVCSSLTILEEISKADEGADKATELARKLEKEMKEEQAVCNALMKNLAVMRQMAEFFDKGKTFSSRVQEQEIKSGMSYFSSKKRRKSNKSVESNLNLLAAPYTNLNLQSPVNGNHVKIDKV